MMIRSLLLSGAASLALATGAMAADLSNMKEPPVFMPPAPPPYSWSGFYIGINGGYGGDQFVYPGSFYDVTNNHSIVSGQASLTSGGFLGGGQVGFNYQFMGNVVAGIEADIDASSIRGQLAANASGFGNTISAAAGTHLDYLGTVRGRLGYAFGNVMPYVTGGFAYGETNSYYNIAFNGVGPAGSEGNWQDG